MRSLSDLSPHRLADLLDVSLGRLRDLASSADSLHTVRHRRKSSGRIRVLHVPCEELREVQRRLNHRLLGRLRVARTACGFVRGRSIRDAAAPHTGQTCVVRLDIADFFPSITRDMVEQALSARDLPGEISALIAQLCTREGRLTQGAPTSPALSNIVFTPFDHRLAGLARRHGARHTRYADDLTFSGDGDLPRIIPRVRSILAEGGFTLRESKTRILRRGGAQRVLGLTVNEGVGVDRETRRRLRAALHRASQGHVVDRERVQGLWAHVWSVNPAQAESLLPRERA